MCPSALTAPGSSTILLQLGLPCGLQLARREGLIAVETVLSALWAAGVRAGTPPNMVDESAMRDKLHSHAHAGPFNARISRP